MGYVNGYLGRISRNPELKQTPQGKNICRFSIASDEGWGERKHTDFIPCVAWEKTAQMICNYFQKGDPMIVEGTWSNRPYKKDEKGYDIPNWSFTVNRVQFLPKVKNHLQDDEDFIPETTNYNVPQAVNYSAAQPGTQPAAPAYGGGNYDDFAVIDGTEDLPF